VADWKEKKTAIGKRVFVVADKTSARISDKATNVLEKAQNRVKASFGGKNSFSILNSFSSHHFVNVAFSCGINFVTSEEKELELISTMFVK
jgi:hypothetical protein